MDIEKLKELRDRILKDSRLGMMEYILVAWNGEKKWSERRSLLADSGLADAWFCEGHWDFRAGRYYCGGLLLDGKDDEHSRKLFRIAVGYLNAAAKASDLLSTQDYDFVLAHEWLRQAILNIPTTTQVIRRASAKQPSQVAYPNRTALPQADAVHCWRADLVNLFCDFSHLLVTGRVRFDRKSKADNPASGDDKIKALALEILSECGRELPGQREIREVVNAGANRVGAAVKYLVRAGLATPRRKRSR